MKITMLILLKIFLLFQICDKIYSQKQNVKNLYVSIDSVLNANIKTQTSFYFKNSDLFKNYIDQYSLNEEFNFYQTYDNTKKTNDKITFELLLPISFKY